jgi:glutathione reductase (NADPH)
MNNFDVVIIGSGTAGQTAAYALQEKGLKVAVVEKSDHPGGTCALAGCQPKKWFYEVAETVAKSKHLKEKGVDSAAVGAWPAVWKQKNKFTSRIPAGTIEGFEASGITVLPDSARFTDAGTLDVGGKPVKAKFYILATGARPMTLPVEGSQHVITSDEFLELKSLPKHILFIGGGFISFEFAHFAARLGVPDCNIVILEVSERPLGPFDPEMVDLLVAASREEGIEVYTGIQITSIKKQAQGYCVTTDAGNTFQAELVVNGAGRVPNIEALDLGAGEINYTAKGVVVDNKMMTSNPCVYAVGDCAATIQLARVADYEAHVAAKNILAQLKDTDSATIDYRSVPTILFSYPQYGMIGKTENALKKEKISYHRSFEKNLRWPTYRRIGLKHAAYKIIVAENKRILGAHFLSDNTAGLVSAIRQAMMNNTRADDLYWQSIMMPYPTRESDLVYMLEPFLS